MPSAPTIIDGEDEEAALEAARHRYHASVLVRDHLESHAANNPGASSDYVTWIATLHPENAETTIDQRFFIPGAYYCYYCMQYTIRRLQYTC